MVKRAEVGVAARSHVRAPAGTVTAVDELAPEGTALGESGNVNADGVAVAGADGSGQMFDAIAGRYDRLNRILSLGLDDGWRRRAVGAMNLGPSATVLDVATGTGDLAIAVAKRDSEVRVFGIDPSAGMLREGRKKVDRLSLENRVVLELGDARDLPFETDYFDAVGIAFGIRNVVDRDAALREMARVTKTNGRVVILELSEPGGLLGLGAKLYLHQIVPRVGALLSGQKEYRYLQKSIAAFPDAPRFAKQLEDNGLQMLDLTPLTFGVSHLYVARPGGGSDESYMSDGGA